MPPLRCFCLFLKWFRLLLLKLRSVDQQHQHHLRSCLKCRTSSPTPDLLHHNPDLNATLSDWYWCSSLRSTGLNLAVRRGERLGFPHRTCWMNVWPLCLSFLWMLHRFLLQLFWHTMSCAGSGLWLFWFSSASCHKSEVSPNIRNQYSQVFTPVLLLLGEITC